VTARQLSEDEIFRVNILLDRIREETRAFNDCDMADKIDVPRSTISRVRAGKYMPTIELIQRAYLYGNMPLIEMFEYLPEPVKKNAGKA